MTPKERENCFIEKCRKDFGVLTFEAEMLLRYGYLAAADEVGHLAYAEGRYEQRCKVLDALGAIGNKERAAP